MMIEGNYFFSGFLFSASLNFNTPALRSKFDHRKFNISPNLIPVFMPTMMIGFK